MSDRQDAIQAMATGMQRYTVLVGARREALVLAETALDALLELLDEKGWTELDESASGGVGHYLWRLSPEGER